MAVGGDILEITYNHPTLGTGTIQVKSGEDSTYDTGGYTSASDQQMITGGGTMIDQMTRKRPFFEATAVWDMNNGSELENCQAMQDSPVLGEWTITNINGTVYKLTGKPVGDLQGNGNASTFTLRVEGTNKMRRIA